MQLLTILLRNGTHFLEPYVGRPDIAAKQTDFSVQKVVYLALLFGQMTLTQYATLVL